MKEEKKTLVEMMVGLLVSTILVLVIGVVVVNDKLAYILGVLFGSVVACIVLLQMYHTLDKAVDMEEKRATRYMVLASIVRLAIMGAALAVGVLLPNLFNVVGILFGLLTLKLCAFIQPIVSKIIAL